MQKRLGLHAGSKATDLLIVGVMLPSEEKRLLTFLKNQILGPNDATLDDVNLARLRHAIEPDFRSDLASTSRGRGQRLSLLDDVSHEEMFRHDQQIDDQQ